MLSGESPQGVGAPLRCSVGDALGAPDVTVVFAHSVLSFPDAAELARLFPGLDRFPRRALLLARPGDVVCVNHRPEQEHLRFLAELGVGCEPENIVVAGPGDGDTARSLPERLLGNGAAFERLVERVRGAGRLRLQPHLASPREFELAAALEDAVGREVHVLGGDADLVGRVYQKHVFRARAMELGVPVAPGEVVHLAVSHGCAPADLSALRSCVERIVRKTGRALIRGTRGASGSSTFVVEGSQRSIRGAMEAIGRSNGNSVYLVEEMLDVVVSPNVQVFVDPDDRKARLISVADQRLDAELGYQGNVYPSRAATLAGMVAAALELTEWLAGEGFSGLAGFDFIECRDRSTGRLRYALSELNPRINGASYPMVMMERFNRAGGPRVGAFLSAKFTTTLRSFAGLRRRYGHLFFDPATGRGLVPYNVGWLKFGMFRAAFFGQNRGEVEALHREFRALLGRE